jgi:hypothetical protein
MVKHISSMKVYVVAGFPEKRDIVSAAHTICISLRAITVGWRRSADHDPKARAKDTVDNRSMSYRMNCMYVGTVWWFSLWDISE